MGKSGADLLVGRAVAGKFTIESLIGSGAMGDVYKARHNVLGTTIALKVMRSDIAQDRMFAERFYREAKAASKLDHPNSIRVLDFGQDPDGLTYLAMEYLDGRDLLRVINEEWPLHDDRIIDVLSQALNALAVAHGLGIIHRDLKPENIMVQRVTDDEGRTVDLIKVCDFGIAKISDPRAFQTGGGNAGKALTTTGTLIGTPEYMSPEQARGDPLDARSDLYSMGVILYQLLTGRPPFTAENALGVVLKQVTDEPVPPSQVRPDVHPRLEAICLRALRKKREERQQSARELRSELRAASGRTISGAGSAPFSAAPEISQAATLPDLPSSNPGAKYASSNPNLAPQGTSSGTEMSIPGVHPTRRAAIAVAVVIGLLAGAGVYVAATPKSHAVAAPPPASTDPARVDLLPVSEPIRQDTAPLGPSTASTLHPVSMVPGTKIAPAASARPSLSASAQPSASSPIAPASAPPAPSPPPPPADPAYSPANAYVEIGMVNGQGVLEPAVRTLLRQLHPHLNGCYRRALQAAGARVAGTPSVNLSIGDTGKIQAAFVQGAEGLPQLARCFQSTLVGQSLSSVDSRGATAEVWFTLHP